MGLVDWDCQDSVCSLEHNPVSMLSNFFFDRRRQIFHVPYVYSDPASILVVIHAKEPRHQGFHWVHIRVAVGLPMSTDEGQAQELRDQDKNIDYVLFPGLFCIFSVRFTLVDKKASSWSLQCYVVSWPRFGITLFQFLFVEKFQQLPQPLLFFGYSCSHSIWFRLSSTGELWHFCSICHECNCWHCCGTFWECMALLCIWSREFDCFSGLSHVLDTGTD